MAVTPEEQQYIDEINALSAAANGLYKNLNATQKAELNTATVNLNNIRTKIQRMNEASSEITSDLNDLSFSQLYRKVGDNAPAKMAHINSLARRITEVERVTEEFARIPVRGAETVFEGPIRGIATVADLAADEEILISKKVATA